MPSPRSPGSSAMSITGSPAASGRRRAGPRARRPPAGLEGGAGVVLAVVAVLGLELLPQEGLLLLFGPGHERQLVRARAGVDPEQERRRSAAGHARRREQVDGHRRQPRGGKTPCSAMQKLRVRYGIMLLCGRLPPAGASACGRHRARGRARRRLRRACRRCDARRAMTVGDVGRALVAIRRPPSARACASGISDSSSVTVSLPPVSPEVVQARGPAPGPDASARCPAGRAARRSTCRRRRRRCRAARRAPCSGDRQQLPVAERPARRREVEREDPDFGDEWIGHGRSPRSGSGRSRTAK